MREPLDLFFDESIKLSASVVTQDSLLITVSALRCPS